MCIKDVPQRVRLLKSFPNPPSDLKSAKYLRSSGFLPTLFQFLHLFSAGVRMSTTVPAAQKLFTSVKPLADEAMPSGLPTSVLLALNKKVPGTQEESPKA